MTLTRRAALGAPLALGLGVGLSSIALPAAAATNTSVGTHNCERGNGSFPDIASIIGWQEVESPGARAKLEDRLPGYIHWSPSQNFNAPANAIPISWRREGFELTGSGSRKTHDGRAKVSPDRYVNWVVLKHRSNNQKIAVVNTHFINGAFNPDVTDNKEYRRRSWDAHADVLRRETRMLRDRGLPVVVVGDFNRPSEMHFPQMRRFRIPGDSGTPIDQMWRNDKVSKRGEAQRLGEFGSDHHAYRVPISY